MNISIINPLKTPGWDDLIFTSEQATFFHTSAWARVLSESYGYKPLYFTAIDNGRLAGLIPVMGIDSFLTGKRGVSLPFTDFCPPVAENGETFKALLNAVLEHGRMAGWKGIEFRGGGGYFGDAPNSAEHFTHTLALDTDEGKVFASFKSNTRRNVRRAGAEGVEAHLLNSQAAVDDFYRLNCITRQDHGLPPQPWKFFRKVFEHIIAARKGSVALAFYQGKPIAGAVFFHFRGAGIYKYGASFKNSHHLRANNLVMWEAIRRFCRDGVQTLSFGRTEPNNEGLLQFKRGWGAKEGRVAYYQLNMRGKVFSTGRNGIGRSYPLCKVLPVPMLRLIGSLLYRHVG